MAPSPPFRPLLDSLVARYAIVLPEPFEAFLTAQVESGHALRRVSDGALLPEFLAAHGGRASAIAAFLDAEARLTVRLDFQALLSLPPLALYTYLIDQLAPLFELQQVALDSELTTGFNSHGREHVSTVARNALRLLRARNPIPHAASHEQETVIGGLLHDIGNLLGRKFHGLYGLYLLSQLFERWDADEATRQSFLLVAEIVIFHEVEFGTQQALFERLDPATLCVIVADKTDVSFRRVSSKSNVPEAMRDAHVLVNLLVAGSQIERLAGDPSRFRWTVDFRTKFDSQHFDLFSSLLKATGRVKYPKEWTALYEEGNIEYLFVFQSTFLSIYLSRLYLALQALFSLYPSVEQFELVIDDAERGISLKRLFTRHDFPAKIVTLGRLFLRDRWPASYLARALAAAMPEEP